MEPQCATDKEPKSAFSDDEEEENAKRAMEEWIDEVQTLLGGTARGSPSRNMKKSRPSSLFKSSRLAYLGSSPVNKLDRGARHLVPSTPVLQTTPPMSYSPSLTSLWFTPGRSPPTPETPDPVPDNPTIHRHPYSSPIVPWRRYLGPLPERPPPPTEPLPERPLAPDVPVDVDSDIERPSPMSSPTNQYTSPLPTYLKHWSMTKVSNVRFSPATLAPAAAMDA